MMSGGAAATAESLFLNSRIEEEKQVKGQPLRVAPEFPCFSDILEIVFFNQDCDKFFFHTGRSDQRLRELPYEPAFLFE
jgi:hypothetical protein